MSLRNMPPARSLSERFSLQTIEAGAAGEDFGRAVASGLRAPTRTLPCRFFYDARGSKLFEEITQLEEYYPTRIEIGILEDHARHIARSFDVPPELVELGSGSAAKTRLLIRELIAAHGSLRFRPIDISRSILESSSRALLADHPALTVLAIAAEYHAGLREIQATDPEQPRLVAWLGSSIGNLSRDAAADFLVQLRRTLRTRDRVLVGVDRRKAPETLIAAYDDAAGVTAAFNRNLLLRANRQLGAEFDLDQFEHRALWREDLGRIEMHLVSLCRQRVWIERLETAFEFEAGETIHTENSYKYSRQEIEQLAARAGLEVEQSWTDGRDWFELALFRVAPDR